MGKFSDMRKKQLEARGAAAPASVRPPAAAPQVEPIAAAPQAAVPAAPAPVSAPIPLSAPAAPPAPAPVPAAPVHAPAAAPPAPVPVPAPVAAPKPPSLPPLPLPPPFSAPAGPSEQSGDAIEVRSGDVDILSIAPIPGSSGEPDLLAAGLPPEAEPVGPAAIAAEATSLPPPAITVHPNIPKPKRRVTGMLGYKAPGDNGFLATGYKLMFRASSATSCTFSLIVKGKELPELVTLELDTPKKVTVPTKNGNMEITLTYKGANPEGQKQVEYVMEGGVEAVTGVMERFRKAGTVIRSAGRKLYQHLPEVIVVGFAAGLAVCGFSMDWIRTELGRLHPYVTAAVPALIAGVAIWAGFEREKSIKKEMESSD
ncbi:MAG: hypothetical protein V1861_05695 [Candidatus Micrarchaeota archaeon]